MSDTAMVRRVQTSIWTRVSQGAIDAGRFGQLNRLSAGFRENRSIAPNDGRNRAAVDAEGKRGWDVWATRKNREFDGIGQQ